MVCCDEAQHQACCSALSASVDQAFQKILRQHSTAQASTPETVREGIAHKPLCVKHYKRSIYTSTVYIVASLPWQIMAAVRTPAANAIACETSRTCDEQQHIGTAKRVHNIRCNWLFNKV